MLFTGMAAMVGCGDGAGLAPEQGSSLLAAPAKERLIQPLGAAASQKGILFGSAARAGVLASDSALASQFTRHCSLVVPENELKWENTEPLPGVFTFEAGDWLADCAARNNMRFRGHTLVWHKQTPAWAGASVSPTEAARQMLSHISGVVSHFAGRVHSWDVVNEPLDPGAGRSDGLRKNAWLNALGPSYIDRAFHAAAEADPNALLVLNEFGLEAEASDADRRRSAALKLLARLKSARVPVHALGVQAHLTSATSVKKLANFLQQVSDLGLQIFITELDVSDQRMAADIPTRDAQVAAAYRTFLETVLSQRAVTTVLTWGLSDGYTWLNQSAPRPDGQASRPLLLDAEMQPKPAFWSMLEAFDRAPVRG